MHDKRTSTLSVTSDEPIGGMEPGPDRQPPGLPELLRSVLTDAGLLIRQEIALAKLEMQRSATRLAKQSVFIAAGGFLIALGLLVLLVFLILLLGQLLGDEYWLSTLIIGALLCVTGLLVIAKGRRGLRRDRLVPAESIASLNETRAWVESEAAEMKRDLTAPQREGL